MTAGIEIIGDLMGRDWHPFLRDVFIDERQSELKTRYFGSMGNSNFLAGYLAVLFPVVLSFGLAVRKRGLRLSAGVLAAGIVLVILLCQSKGSLLALLLGCAVFAGLVLTVGMGEGKRRFHPRLSRVIGGGIAFAFLLAGTVFLSGLVAKDRKQSYTEQWLGLLDLRGESLSQRVLLAYCGLEMWKESPWAGIGPGEFRLRFLPMIAAMLEGEDGEAFQARVERLKSFKPVNLHNDWLQVLVEWGIIGYASLLAFLAALVWTAIRRMKASKGTVPWFRLGALSGAVTGMGYGLFEFPLHLSPHLALIAALLGWAIAPSGDALEPSSQSPWRRRVARIWGIPIVIVAVFLLWRGVATYSASRLAAEAREISNRGSENIAEVSGLMKQAVRLDPGNAELDLQSALFQWKVDKSPARAVDSLRRGGPISDDPLFSLLEAQITLENGQLARAHKAIAPLRSVAPYLPGVGFIDGSIQEARRDLEAAAAAYGRDIQALANHPEIPHPDLPSLRLRYGSVLEELGNYRDALRQYDHLAELVSNASIAFLRMGIIYRDHYRDFTSARRFFDRALESAEQDPRQVEMRQVHKEIQELKNLERAARAALPVLSNATGEE